MIIWHGKLDFHFFFNLQMHSRSTSLALYISSLNTTYLFQQPIAVATELEESMDAAAAEEETSMLEADTATDPLWILYHSVKNYKDGAGLRLSEPFIRLPDKRIYPDYYEEIRKPMSFLKIQKKIKVGGSICVF